MAKQLSAVSIKMLDGTTYYVSMTEFNSGGVPEKADSVIGNYIHGSRGPMLKVNTAADFTGSELFVNPKLIVTMTPTFS